jgi:5-methylcytosine-specific restriction endonuclease McrA
MCTKCGLDKTPNKNGVMRCLPCKRLYERQRYPRIRTKLLAYQKKYSNEKFEYIKARSQRWYKDNQERELAKRRVYCRNNRDKTAEYCRRARAKRREAILVGTPAEIAAKIQAQNGRCFDCGRKSKLTAGHLIPLVRGGSHSVHNVVGQCYPCNRKQWTNIHPKAGITIFDRVSA